MEWSMERLTQKHALEIANDWKYDDIYSFYDMTADPEDYDEFVDEALRNKNDHYEVWKCNELVGFFCVMPEQESLEIGLGMKPDLCGKGLGREFVTELVAFVERNYRVSELVMHVALFNQRAIRVYRSCGFQDAEITKRYTNGGVYDFLTMVKKRQICNPSQ